MQSKIQLGLYRIYSSLGAGFVGIAAGRPGHADGADQRAAGLDDHFRAMPLQGTLHFSVYCCGFDSNTFLRRRASSAASANSQSRNVAIFGFAEVALGQTIQ